MQVAIYARVSTQRQAQAQTIEQQLERLTSYVSQHEWELSEENIFREDGFSGAVLNMESISASLVPEHLFKTQLLSVDNLEDATQLTEKMKANLPISARPTRETLKMLRKQGYPLSDRQTLSINSVFYGGNEMGIACEITPPGKQQQVVVCSLTHLEIIGDTSLAEEMRAYQEKRKKKLAQLPNGTPGSFTIKRKP